jgi:hypothetical protein
MRGGNQNNDMTLYTNFRVFANKFKSIRLSDLHIGRADKV